jgi:hypothetical protein
MAGGTKPANNTMLKHEFQTKKNLQALVNSNDKMKNTNNKCLIFAIKERSWQAKKQ